MAERKRKNTRISSRDMLGRMLALGMLAAVVLGLTYLAMRYAAEIEAGRQMEHQSFDSDKSPGEAPDDDEEEMEDRPDEDGFIPGQEEDDSEADDEGEEDDGRKSAPPPLSGEDGAAPSREQ